jgi:predicted nucleic acid-binding protein
MTTFLCDTNILSELARLRPDTRVAAWAQGVSSMAVSVITVEEITYGLAWKPNPRILDWFQEYLSAYSEILPITAEIAERSGILRGTLRARGRTRTQADMLIAATAQAHGLTLATRNAKDFEDCGLSLIDPFV